LFLGYTVLDPQLWHMRRSIFSQKVRGRSYAVQCALPPLCQEPGAACLDNALWGAMGLSWQSDHEAIRVDDGAVEFLELVKRSVA
jgi:hypothetical protein